MNGVNKMHSYSTDSNERMFVPFYLAVISIVSAWFLPRLIEIMGLAVPWWFDAPAVIGFYGIYYKLFDKFLWKRLVKIGLIQIPNLNGNWIGHFQSSYDGHTTQKHATIEVKQSWTKMCIVFKSGTSRSKSISSSIITTDAEGYVLSYEYQNEPNYNSVSTMQIHRGFTRLILSRDKKELEGDYYTGRGRLNYGTMNFRKT
jgi:hypothetical protein